MPNDPLAILERLGFSAYAAKAWLTLAQADTLTGYEIAKRSGTPRANIYAVLKRLIARGAVRRIDTHDGTRYTATPAARLLERIEAEQRHLLDAAHATLPRPAAPAPPRPVYTLDTPPQVHTAARQLIAEAQQDLFIAVQPQEAALLGPALREARERGINITTLCMEACATECGSCCGSIHRCTLPSAAEGRWLLVAADTVAMVAAEFGTASVRAIETRQPLIVQLAVSYVRQSAALAVLDGALGDRFEGLVSLQARRLLDGLRPRADSRQSAQRTAAEAVAPRPVSGTQQEKLK